MMFLISCANIRIIFRIVNLWLAWRGMFLAFLCIFVRFVVIQFLAAAAGRYQIDTAKNQHHCHAFYSVKGVHAPKHGHNAGHERLYIIVHAGHCGAQ